LAERFTRCAVAILQAATGLEIEAVVLVRGQAEDGRAAAHLLLGETVLELILTTVGELAVHPHPQQSIHQSAGGIGVGLEDVAGLLVLLEGRVGMQQPCQAVMLAVLRVMTLMTPPMASEP
jgi:hypothetical protein